MPKPPQALASPRLVADQLNIHVPGSRARLSAHFLKTWKSSPKLCEVQRSWLPWYIKGTIPPASSLSIEMNGLSPLHCSCSQKGQGRALSRQQSPLLGKPLLFWSQHTHLHPAHPPFFTLPTQPSSTGDSTMAQAGARSINLLWRGRLQAAWLRSALKHL